MGAKDVQQRAADVLLERGVRVKLPAPFWYKIIGKKHREYMLQRPKLGTLVALSKIAAEIDADFDKLDGGSINESFRLVSEHGNRIAEFVAVAILNDKDLIEHKTSKLAKRITWGLATDRLAEIFTLIVIFSGVQDFINTIRFVAQTNVMKATTNLSHDETGS